LENEKNATQAMRRVTFTMGERLVLIPVELSELIKPTLLGIGFGFCNIRHRIGYFFIFSGMASGNY
jgi:uncharacterized membrane protein